MLRGPPCVPALVSTLLKCARSSPGGVVLPAKTHKYLTPCIGCLRRQLSTSEVRCRLQLPVFDTWLCTRGSQRTLASTGTSSGDSSEGAKVEAAGKSTTVSIKVQPTVKSKLPRLKTDFTKVYTDNVYITPLRAMNEYQLKPGDLESLPNTKRRSPFSEIDGITVFLRSDVEKKAVELWGSMESVKNQRKKARAQELRHNANLFNLKKALREYKKQHGEFREEKPFIFQVQKGRKWPPKEQETIFKLGSGKVVVYAIAVNTANLVLKFIAWLYTGSHSMFSEFIHSAADTVNQVILAVGIYQSLKRPDMEHPYGWANFRNVSSLISGVGIFCLGAGLSFYHGIQGLLNPTQMESLFWAIAVLFGSFVSEGATLLVAVNQVRSAAQAVQMDFMEYVWRGADPSTNVVLLEDLAAVVGVTVAATCMGITYYTGNHLADAIGSLLIGSLLASVASFIIYTNTITLVGRSIPLDRKMSLMRELEGDRMIRALHDVKATEMGGPHIRFKAEVDFDGREITRLYLEKQDMEKMLEELRSFESLDQVEQFMLKHGENIVDTLGSEVDRIETNLKEKHPEVRHVDLEQL